MAMGYSGYSAEVISLDAVEKLGLESYEKLKEETKKMKFESDSELADMVIDRYFDTGKYTHQEAEEYYEVYSSFVEEFHELTGIGIELQYHDSENNGDIYDEVNGLFFNLNFNDIYKMTTAAKALNERLGFDVGYYVFYG